MKSTHRTTYRPTPYREGCKIVKEEYTKPFIAMGGITGIATYVDFLDKKGNLIEEYFLRIKWND